MPKFIVQLRRTLVEDIDVEMEADSPEQAEKLAKAQVQDAIGMDDPELNWDLQEDKLDTIDVSDAE